MSEPRYCTRGHEQTPEMIGHRGRCKECARIVGRATYARGRDEINRRARARYAGAKARPRKPYPSVILGRKVCPRCKRWRHIIDFPPRTTMKGQTAPHSYCHGCFRAAARDTRRRIMADPVRLADRRERDRFYAEGKRRAAGIPERNWSGNGSRVPDRTYELVPSAPIVAWLDSRIAEETEATLCDRAGLAERVVYRMRHEADRVSLGIVDRLLFAAGESYRLDDLYPVKAA